MEVNRKLPRMALPPLHDLTSLSERTVELQHFTRRDGFCCAGSRGDVAVQGSPLGKSGETGHEICSRV